MGVDKETAAKTSPIKCSRCSSVVFQRKSGKRSDGVPQIKCVICGRRYVEDYKQNTYVQDDKKRVALLHEEGNSSRFISRKLGIPKSTVSRWIKQITEDLEKNS